MLDKGFTTPLSLGQRGVFGALPTEAHQIHWGNVGTVARANRHTPLTACRGLPGRVLELYELFLYEAPRYPRQPPSSCSSDSQKTQYGFRRRRGTSDAIQLVRRIAEYGEKTTNPLIMVLLDWQNILIK